MTKPRIIFVSRKWPPAVGGMETYAQRLTDALEPSTELKRIVLPGRPDGSPPGSLALGFFGLQASFRILLGRRHADVIHVGDMASWLLALPARIGLGNAAIVLSAHGTDVTYPRRGTTFGHLYARYLRLGAWLLRNPTVIANSRATEAEVQRYGFTSTRAVPLATDFTRRKVDFDPNRLLFSGRIIPLKGLSWFVENVLDHLPDEITLDVAGTIWDRDEATCLKHPRVNHLGHLNQDELAEAFARALAVVIPNVPVASGQFEGFGLVAIEAAAAGGVVLASDHGGLAEAVIDGETGYSLPAGHAEAWIAAIRNVRAWDPARRKSMTDLASETAKEVFSWDRVARDILAAYAQAMESRNS